MKNGFTPLFSLTDKLNDYLDRIEMSKNKSILLPMNPRIMASLRQTAKLFTTHYSTMIEGNQLEAEQIQKVLNHNEHFPGRERDEKEVKGYYAAIALVEKYAAEGKSVSETMVKTLHALVMSNGREKVRPSPYRKEQNVIRDGISGGIVYMPPEAKDVTILMKQLVVWIKKNHKIPTPIVAAITHYQFATIHPYFDGNGRTARLLTTLVLHLGGYDLKGLYSLEEYYAKNLPSYYEAISVGPSHNYYLGRAETDITQWIEYFCKGMAIAFENVVREMERAQIMEEPDHCELLRTLDPKQRKALELFRTQNEVTSAQLAILFSFSQRAARALCQKWVKNKYIKIANFSNKSRTYSLTEKHQDLLLTSSRPLSQ